jgi:hypothetical protein
MSDPDEDPTLPEDQEPPEDEDPSLLTTDPDSAGMWVPRAPMPKLPKLRRR